MLLAYSGAKGQSHFYPGDSFRIRETPRLSRRVGACMQVSTSKPFGFQG